MTLHHLSICKFGPINFVRKKHVGFATGKKDFVGPTASSRFYMESLANFKGLSLSRRKASYPLFNHLLLNWLIRFTPGRKPFYNFAERVPTSWGRRVNGGGQKEISLWFFHAIGKGCASRFCLSSGGTRSTKDRPATSRATPCFRESVPATQIVETSSADRAPGLFTHVCT